MVNQATKVALGVIKAVTNNINAIATDRINQIISQGGKEMERALPKILHVGIEDVNSKQRNMKKASFSSLEVPFLNSSIIGSKKFIFAQVPSQHSKPCFSPSAHQGYFYNIQMNNTKSLLKCFHFSINTPLLEKKVIPSFLSFLIHFFFLGNFFLAEKILQ